MRRNGHPTPSENRERIRRYREEAEKLRRRRNRQAEETFEPTRRGMLGIMLAAIGTLGVGANFFKFANEESVWRRERVRTPRPVEESSEAELETELPEIEVPREIQSEKMGGLNAFYLDVKPGEKPPKRKRFNFPKIIGQMWDQKLRRFAEDVDDAKKYRDLIVQKYEHYYSPEGRQHDDHRPISLPDYVNIIDTVSYQTLQELDWDRVERALQLKDGTGPVTRKALEKLAGLEMLAFSMTEIMASGSDGKLNARVYSFLLENAGEEFVNAVPAIGDALLSYGPCQMTKIALNEVKKLKKALFVGGMISDLPETMDQIEGTEAHFRLAMLNAVVNIGRLVNGLTKSEREEFLKLPAQEITEIVSAMHHRPSAVYKDYKEWRKLVKTNPNATFDECCGEQVGIYVQKTRANYKALKNREFGLEV